MAKYKITNIVPPREARLRNRESYSYWEERYEFMQIAVPGIRADQIYKVLVHMYDDLVATRAFRWPWQRWASKDSMYQVWADKGIGWVRTSEPTRLKGRD